MKNNIKCKLYASISNSWSNLAVFFWNSPFKISCYTVCESQYFKYSSNKIMDNKPMVNIVPFGMCNTLSNPQVAVATSAAMGVLTPQPYIPLIVAPWTPGSPTGLIGSTPALIQPSTCMCTWGGIITIIEAG